MDSSTEWTKLSISEFEKQQETLPKLKNKEEENEKEVDPSFLFREGESFFREGENSITKT